MAYIGADPANKGTGLFSQDTFTGDGSTTTYTMTQAASEVKQIMVFVGGVHQDPATSYGVSTTTLTFTSAVPNGEIVNVVHDLYSTDVT